MKSAVLSYLLSRQWAMDPDHLIAMADEMALAIDRVPQQSLPAGSSLLDVRAEGANEARYDVRGGVAHIRIAGPMLKEVPWLFELLGIRCTSTVAARQAVEAAQADSSVGSIALDIDSPGGDVAGVQELADAVRACWGLNKKKKVTAQVSDLCASAAYWVASQATRITANEAARIGSIGAIAVIQDSSAAAAAAGIAVHVIRSSEMKGGPVPGSAVTADQLAEAKRIVDETAAMFCDAVARGRRLTSKEVAAVATGQTWLAKDAKARGLIDGIASSATEASKPPPVPELVAASTEETAVDLKEAVVKIEAQADQITKLEASTKEMAEKLAAAEAQRKATEEANLKLRAEQRDALILKYTDRIAPADLPAVKEYAAFCADDLVKLEGFLKARPVLTHATRLSAAGDTPDTKRTADLTPEMLAVAKQMGNSPEDLRKFGGLKAE